jgi:hypothetical protein
VALFFPTYFFVYEIVEAILAYRGMHNCL